jgi:uncharacterized membrane protein YoaK (UPF0700 family)
MTHKASTLNKASYLDNTDYWTIGYCLTMIAGALNAGAFLAVSTYTSHVTGLLSSLANMLATGQVVLAFRVLCAVACFLLGAIFSSFTIHYFKTHNLKGGYAFTLATEAVLLMVLAVFGQWVQPYPSLVLSGTIIVLCFIMGLQNSFITTASRYEIRTTHMSGIVTDIGIELGKLLYKHSRPQRSDDACLVVPNYRKLHKMLRLLVCFVSGGIVGSLGFIYLQFYAVLPMSMVLFILSARLYRDRT